MSAEGDRRRQLIGPLGEQAAQEAADAAPEFSPELRDRLALLFRTLRRKPGSDTSHTGSGDERDDVA